ncbi:unnamed protein product [Ixodes pacificus]
MNDGSSGICKKLQSSKMKMLTQRCLCDFDKHTLQTCQSMEMLREKNTTKHETGGLNVSRKETVLVFIGSRATKAVSDVTIGPNKYCPEEETAPTPARRENL